MKKTKWIVALLTVALVVGMVAVFAVSCGEGDDNGDANGDANGGTESTDATTDGQPARPGISGVSEDVEVVSAEDTGQTYTGDDAFKLSLGMPSAASLYKVAVEPWTEAIMASGDGRIEFDIYSSNTLVKEEQQLEALDNGTSDILVFQAGWAPGVFPLLELGDLPMVFDSAQQSVNILWDLMDEFRPEELADYHVLGLMMISEQQWGGNVPVRSVEDFQGLVIRSGSPVETDTIRALGATDYPAGTDYVGTQIQRDVFDGLFFSWSFHAANALRYYSEYTECDMFLRTMCVVMKKDTWESLPLAVQEAFNENSGREASLQWVTDDALFNYDNSLFPAVSSKGEDYLLVETTLEERGKEIYVLSAAERAEWRAAVQPVIEDWIDTYAGKLESQAIYDRYLELLDEYPENGDAATGDSANGEAEEAPAEEAEATE